MGKTIRTNNPQTKKYEKEKKNCGKDHLEEYSKHHEKGHYPRRVWPTDSEKSKHKGPKF